MLRVKPVKEHVERLMCVQSADAACQYVEQLQGPEAVLRLLREVVSDLGAQLVEVVVVLVDVVIGDPKTGQHTEEATELLDLARQL